MSTHCLPAYPTTSDMGCAMWLRHFAAKLPNYAGRYELAATEVAQVQGDALAFVARLTHKLLVATQAITQPGQAGARPSKVPAAVRPEQQDFLAAAARLVRAIRAHRHYRIVDGIGLELNLTPACEGFAALPAPQLCVVGYQVLDEYFAVALRWDSYPEAVLDLAVCRDGHTWQPPQLVAGDCYADIHSQPQELMQWCYRARYRRPDWPVGPWGDVATVELGYAHP